MSNNISFNLVLFGLAVFISVSCESKKPTKSKALNDQPKTIEKPVENEDLALLKMRCYACHQVSSKSHDEIIAPPLAAVKRRYLRSFPEREAFINAIVNWTMDPKEKNALMYGAVKKFKVMPYQSFDKSEMSVIAGYIYDNDLEEPEWFEEHEAEMHRGKSEN
ncbi:c-type cytochrome [Namhaeicola litoreus]|uniref:C-type cytochrome n=1 Tax=Namhaeicola litoreus TaxID=1052145 RepID=A0ABW3Y132_9FLAO